MLCRDYSLPSPTTRQKSHPSCHVNTIYRAPCLSANQKPALPPADQSENSDERGWQSVNVNVVLYVHILSLDTKLHHNASNNNNIKMHGYHQYK